jgi:hypothetical protein
MKVTATKRSCVDLMRKQIFSLWRRSGWMLSRVAVALSCYISLHTLLYFVEEHAKNKYFGPTIAVQDHWHDFVMYNATAQSALRDLRNFARTNNLSLPLFSLATMPRICVGIATARRANSQFKCRSPFSAL